ncbi:hypothetical protein [Teredinibacter turnerae]|uniref:hypothetical protein n=1 Tax=Teredinibacter turnerae TaxID=2426 RepID=UPI0005F76A5D|nr:hypothetical protein [Teredinibacter turnerae]
MSRSLPELEDYVRLFHIYGKDLGSIYKEESESDPYFLLFEQIVALLLKPSSFNLSLPEQFRKVAHRYHRGDEATLFHMGDSDNRHFMLCDLHDLIMLRGGLQLKRRMDAESQDEP